MKWLLTLSSFCLVFQLSSQDISYSDNIEINQLANCQRLIKTGKTKIEKDELQKDYWTLLGIISDLSEYRQSYLAEGKFIDLFPTAYYHTTYLEMQSILSLKFAYPLETMKQMIAFYDAYKLNRDNWDKEYQSVVEEHWKNHFEDAESFWSSANILCMKTGDALSTAISAHVQYDLQRAIRYAANERSNKSISFSQYKTIMNPDFTLTDTMFETSMIFTLQDISTASLCKQFVTQIFSSDKYGKFIGIIIPNSVGLTQIFTDADVINMRHKAWKNAFSTDPFFEPSESVMDVQPILDHQDLIEIGKKLCTAKIERINDSPVAEQENHKNDTPSNDEPAVGKIVFSGVKTPDELGRKIVLALKTNNKQMWNNCILHTTKEENDKRFDELRSCLQSRGVGDWNLLQFSRVTYVSSGHGYAFFKIEVNYGKDYAGIIGGSYGIFYKENFMMDAAFNKCNLFRK